MNLHIQNPRQHFDVPRTMQFAWRALRQAALNELSGYMAGNRPPKVLPLLDGKSLSPTAKKLFFDIPRQQNDLRVRRPDGMRRFPEGYGNGLAERIRQLPKTEQVAMMFTFPDSIVNQDSAFPWRDGLLATVRSPYCRMHTFYGDLAAGTGPEKSESIAPFLNLALVPPSVTQAFIDELYGDNALTIVPKVNNFGPEEIAHGLGEQKRLVQIPFPREGATEHVAHGVKMCSTLFYLHDIHHLFESAYNSPREIRRFYPRWYRIIKREADTKAPHTRINGERWACDYSYALSALNYLVDGYAQFFPNSQGNYGFYLWSHFDDVSFFRDKKAVQSLRGAAIIIQDILNHPEIYAGSPFTRERCLTDKDLPNSIREAFDIMGGDNSSRCKN